VITGISLTGVTLITRLNGSLAFVPSFTLTGTLKSPEKLAAGVIVAPETE
jgi:hypothetical protein